MMSIRDKWQYGNLPFRRPDNFGAILTTKCGQKDPNEIGSISYQFGFYLEATVRVEFYANKAQYDDARKNAEKQALNLIYEGLRGPLLQARSCIYARDPQGALEALGQIEREIGL